MKIILITEIFKISSRLLYTKHTHKTTERKRIKKKKKRKPRTLPRSKIILITYSATKIIRVSKNNTNDLDNLLAFLKKNTTIRFD